MFERYTEKAKNGSVFDFYVNKLLYRIFSDNSNFIPCIFTVNARFYVYPPKKKSDILYLVTDNPRTIVYNYFYTS